MENDRRLLNYFDCHLHTKSSHDSTEEHSAIIKHALEEGLAGYMVTDHVDILRAEGEAFLSPAYDSFENYSRLVSSGYEGTLAEVKGNEAPLLEIRFGVELGDSIRNKKASAKLIADLPFDAVLLAHRDDTRGSYETLLEISETVRGENAAVIVENCVPME